VAASQQGGPGFKPQGQAGEGGGEGGREGGRGVLAVWCLYVVPPVGFLPPHHKNMRVNSPAHEQGKGTATTIHLELVGWRASPLLRLALLPRSPPSSEDGLKMQRMNFPMGD